jgi:hypothetical protein
MTINVEMKMELINDTNASLKPMDGGASATPSRRSFIRLVGGGAVLCVIMLPVGREPSKPATSVKGGLSHLHRDRFGLIEGGTGVRFGHGTTGKHHRHE